MKKQLKLKNTVKIIKNTSLGISVVVFSEKKDRVMTEKDEPSTSKFLCVRSRWKFGLRFIVVLL